jgi:cytidylate kinase
MQIVYIISGPPGVGKTSISKELALKIPHSKLISGDDFLIPLKNTGLDYSQIKHETWKKILRATQEKLSAGNDVIIDFVVEDELSWVSENLKSLMAKIKYIVLIADEQSILDRLTSRDGLDFKDRALFVLNKLKHEPSNKEYLFDTTGLKVSDITNKIIDSDSYYS